MPLLFDLTTMTMTTPTTPTSPPLNVFVASYYESGRYGYYYEAEYVICANTESEALGFALSAEPKTTAKHWSFLQINTATAGTTKVLTRSS